MNRFVLFACALACVYNGTSEASVESDLRRVRSWSDIPVYSKINQPAPLVSDKKTKSPPSSPGIPFSKLLERVQKKIKTETDTWQEELVIGLGSEMAKKRYQGLADDYNAFLKKIMLQPYEETDNMSSILGLARAKVAANRHSKTETSRTPSKFDQDEGFQNVWAKCVIACEHSFNDPDGIVKVVQFLSNNIHGQSSSFQDFLHYMEEIVNIDVLDLSRDIDVVRVKQGKNAIGIALEKALMEGANV